MDCVFRNAGAADCQRVYFVAAFYESVQQLIQLEPTSPRHIYRIG